MMYKLLTANDRQMRKKIILVAGARPNFMKIAPLIREFKKHKNKFSISLVHTGQHYDFEMSGLFFQNLNIPRPDIYLKVGSHSHAVQTARIMSAFEKVALDEKPDLVMVVGDVNSTLACSLVASKLRVRVAHVEAGLRSFDRTMPEEINRIVTDSLSDYLFVSEESGIKNLKREGVHPGRIFFVGNVMIDTLLWNMKQIDKSPVLKSPALKCNSSFLKPRSYSVLTLHRPNNVDSPKALSEIFDILTSISEYIKIIYPVHPRTRKMIKSLGFADKFAGITNLTMIDPLGYIDFIKLVKNSLCVLTDSGGIQEESTVLGIPCLTMRENTERPVTLSEGTNYLVGRNKKKIIQCVRLFLNGKAKKKSVPQLWDGKAAQRIVKIIAKSFDEAKG